MKKGIVALALLSALLLILVSSASGAVWQTKKSEWFSGSTGTTLPIGSSKSLNIVSGSNILLRGNAAGQVVKIEWKKVNCFSCVIENIAAPSPVEVEAKATISLGLEEGSVVEPVGCTLGTITFQPLVETIGMKEGGSGAPAKFVPKEGEKIATMEISKCAIAGKYSLSGSFYAESSNATGVSATSQSQNMSESIQKELGGALKLGTEPAFLTGTFKNQLSTEETFQVKE